MWIDDSFSEDDLIQVHLSTKDVDLEDELSGERKLILGIIAKARQDLIDYRNFFNYGQLSIYKSAEQIIFDKNYTVNVDGEKLTLEDFCVVVGGSALSLRKEIIKYMENAKYNNILYKEKR